MVLRHLQAAIPTRAGLERRGFTTALIRGAFIICVESRPVALPAMLIPAGFSANRNRGRSCTRRPTACRATNCKTTYLERHVVPWLQHTWPAIILLAPEARPRGLALRPSFSATQANGVDNFRPAIFASHQIPCGSRCSVGSVRDPASRSDF